MRINSGHARCLVGATSASLSVQKYVVGADIAGLSNAVNRRRTFDEIDVEHMTHCARDYSPMHVKIAPRKAAFPATDARGSRPRLIRAFEMVLASQVADAIGIMPQRR